MQDDLNRLLKEILALKNHLKQTGVLRKDASALLGISAIELYARKIKDDFGKAVEQAKNKQ